MLEIGTNQAIFGEKSRGKKNEIPAKRMGQ